MALPLARRSAKDGNERPLDKEALRRLFEVAGVTSEGLIYLKDQAKQTQALDLEKNSFIDDAINTAEEARRSIEGSDIMGGEAPPTAFIALQEAYNNQAAKALQDSVKTQRNITMNFEVQTDGTMLRGYSQNSVSLDSEDKQSQKIVDSLDTMVKAWMAEHDILYHDGKLLAADKNGEIQKNATAAPITISPEEFSTLINDSRKGIVAHMEKSGVNLQLDTTQNTSAMQAEESLPLQDKEALIQESTADAKDTAPKKNEEDRPSEDRPGNATP